MGAGGISQKLASHTDGPAPFARPIVDALCELSNIQLPDSDACDPRNDLLVRISEGKFTKVARLQDDELVRGQSDSFGSSLGTHHLHLLNG